MEALANFLSIPRYLPSDDRLSMMIGKFNYSVFLR